MSLKIFLMISCLAVFLHSQTMNTISGTVTSKSGVQLSNAIVTLEGMSIATETDNFGKYSIGFLKVSKNITSRNGSIISFDANKLIIHSKTNTTGIIETFNLKGQLQNSLNFNVKKGSNHINLGTDFKSNLLLVRIRFDGQSYLVKIHGKNNSLSILSSTPSETKNTTTASALVSRDTLRVSKAGYLTVRIPLESLNGTFDVVLDSLPKVVNGSDPISDGSYDRIATNGKAEYYWGTILGKEEPLVKIIHAVNNDVIDIYVIFSPHFIDNTYGTNAINWPAEDGHRFFHLYHSDHVALAVNNGNGDTVFAGTLDLISPNKNVPSGYSCLGPFGGEGSIIKGNASDVVSFGNSMCDNFNQHGYVLLDNSPATDTTYKINPDYPFWQYYVVYRLTLKASIFGTSGYGKVEMTSVHASPSKDAANETIYVTSKTQLVKGTEYDVFKYYNPTVTSTAPDIPDVD